MEVSIHDILKNPMLRSIRLLSGEETRMVNRVSVFDCKVSPSVDYTFIIQPGDLFITCMGQFEPEDRDAVEEFLRLLIDHRSAGLLIVSDHNMACMAPEIVAYCEKRSFPVLYLEEDVPYAVIMDIINRYLSVKNLNELNLLKLDRITDGRRTQTEQLNVLRSMNPNILDHIMVISASGKFRSGISSLTSLKSYWQSKKDIMVEDSGTLTLIISEATPKALETHYKVSSAHLHENLILYAVGCSRQFPCGQIAAALEEGRQAMTTAVMLGLEEYHYNPMSSMQLLLPMRGAKVIDDFRESFLSAIREKFSEETEILKTIHLYVQWGGDIKKTAAAMNQHENTIRYRINKVKEALNMTNNQVMFHETIALMDKIQKL